MEHFSSIYSSSTFTPLVIENLLWNPIEASQASTLIKPFTMEEIKDYVLSFDSNKALGPDGSTIDFSKKFGTLLT